MDDLISRQAAIDALTRAFATAAEMFEGLPSAQPVPQECEKCIFQSFKQFQPAQRTGRWILVTGRAICTVCGKSPSWCYIEGSMEWPYCPNCGCAMKGEQDG